MFDTRNAHELAFVQRQFLKSLNSQRYDKSSFQLICIKKYLKRAASIL